MKNLRTQAQFHAGTAGSWQLQRTETYGYDTLDQLTSANYGDGLPHQNVTWDYDAAGNRISDSSQAGSWTYDNLDRMTASPGFSYTNDILGNRLTRGSTTCGWDILNRMTSFTSGSTSIYEYRADGLRTKKTRPSETTTYYYDGQMAIEEQVTGGTPSVTSYGIGGRGIDLIAKDGNVSFPIYDGHGNMISTLARSGDSYSLSNLRYFDAWGQIRQGNQTGDPSQRYCASLGHKQDDESGLVYMRARYYEPTTGRFISEDPARDQLNWYAYVSSNPLNLNDPSGKTQDSITATLRTTALRSLATGKWDDFVDLLEIIVTAFGGPVEGGISSEIIEALQSVPTPRRGFRKGVKHLSGAHGHLDELAKHIMKIMTQPNSTARNHWFNDMRTLMKNIYRDLDN